jgi:hypothetical protein
MIERHIPHEFTLLARMPTQIPVGKFMQSPLYAPQVDTMKTVGEADPMGAVKKKEQEGKYEDIIQL